MDARQDLIDRVRGEYAEMPGLSLTLQQACRLWRLEHNVCQALLDQLTREGYLCRLPDNRFVARDHALSRVRFPATSVQRPSHPLSR